MDEPLQKSLERYDVLDRIAVGGMAEVFLAKAYGAHGFEKTLAIKRILPELARDPEFAARFIAEAKVAVKLSHANVVQVFDFGRIGDALFIAMEYVDGLDLALLLRKFKDEKRLLPLPAAFHIAIEIIRALDFAHGHGVVHRDVSPSNILISRAGEVKIGDFGIAVAAAPHKAGGPGLRKVMGKWRYMSPEQARGDTLDTRSDLFSAGSVLFELFTGEKLFPGDEAEDIVKNIETMPLPRASSVRPALPSRLDEILAGPLARKPIDRPMRPATVLRSLIELSYESSIMATALDVAEAVASVLPAKRISGPGQQLDDVIRKQLGQAQAEKSVARRTAVTDGKPPSTSTLERGERSEHSTGLFRKIGADGLSTLEEMDVDPTGVAPPRHTEPMVKSPDSGLHRLLEKVDGDRRTEPGAPPTGVAPKLDLLEPPAAGALPVLRGTTTTGAKSLTTFTGASRRGWWIAAAVAALAGGGAFAVWKLEGASTEVVAPAVHDAGVVEQFGVMEIDPRPDGAKGTITGVDGIAHEFGPTPVRQKVSANTKLHVHIELPGYQTIDDDRTVPAGETMVIAPHLVKARAGLHVTTSPPGAQVALDHRVLGDTPLVRDDLDEVANADLVITKGGFDPIREKIDLVVGHPLEVTETLKPAQRYGLVTLSIRRGWGDVMFKGTKLGSGNPIRNLRLPIGKQVLHIKNPPSGKQWDVTCDVVEGQTKLCQTSMP
ncbi:MAG: serine/threonine-protein kinase [Kofleriaceae bacterium]